MNKKIQAHYWLDDSYYTDNPPWRKPGDPPWGKVRVNRQREVSKEEFEKSMPKRHSKI